MKKFRTITLFVLSLALLMACTPQSQSTPTGTTVPQPKSDHTRCQLCQRPRRQHYCRPFNRQQHHCQIQRRPPSRVLLKISSSIRPDQKETTWFYFMNAHVDQTVYALVDDLEGKSYSLICPPMKLFRRICVVTAKSSLRERTNIKLPSIQIPNTSILSTNKLWRPI